MKRILLYIFIAVLGLFFTVTPSYADAYDEAIDDDLSAVYQFDRDWRENQEAVTDKEFEEVMQRFEKKKKPKKYEFEADEDRDMLNDMSMLYQIADHSPTVLFPTNLRSYEGEFIPAGFYKLSYEKKNNIHYITVSQGRKVFATLEMQESSQIHDTDTIQFAEIVSLDNETVKLIYGNIDLNLEKKLYVMN